VTSHIAGACIDASQWAWHTLTHQLDLGSGLTARTSRPRGAETESRCRGLPQQNQGAARTTHSKKEGTLVHKCTDASAPETNHLMSA